MMPEHATSAKGALSGLKVLGFGWMATAPLVDAVLSDYGATVVKVESFKRVDPFRVMIPYSQGISGSNRCLMFLPMNRGKYSMCLDLQHPKGLDVAKRLVKWADVVTDNWTPKSLEKIGLGYEALKQVNPRIIMLRTTIGGQEGPYSQGGGLGVMLQALPGLVYPMGWPGEGPTPIPLALTDFMGPIYTLIALFTALEYRTKTGEGTCVDVSQFEAGVNFIAPAVLDYVVNGTPQSRTGNSLPYAAPHNAYRCKGDDRWCAIAVFSEQEWKAFCGVMGNPQWTKDPKFSTLARRKENEAELDRFVHEWTINHSPEEVMGRMQAAGIAAGVVEGGKDICEDPQLAHRRHFQRLDTPEVGAFDYSVAPPRLSKTPPEIRLPSASIGQHTEFVCREFLNMSDEEFIALFQEGAFSRE